MGRNDAKFIIKARQKFARVGELHLHHAVVHTPVYMPVGT